MIRPGLAVPGSGSGHGTIGGAHTHRRHGERPCRSCADALATYAAWRRFVKGTQELRRCRACGSVFDGHMCGMGGHR